MTTHLSQAQTHNAYKRGSFNGKLHQASLYPAVASYAHTSYGVARRISMHTLTFMRGEQAQPTHAYAIENEREREMYFISNSEEL